MNLNIPFRKQGTPHKTNVICLSHLKKNNRLKSLCKLLKNIFNFYLIHLSAFNMFKYVPQIGTRASFHFNERYGVHKQRAKWKYFMTNNFNALWKMHGGFTPRWSVLGSYFNKTSKMKQAHVVFWIIHNMIYDTARWSTMCHLSTYVNLTVIRRNVYHFHNIRKVAQWLLAISTFRRRRGIPYQTWFSFTKMWKFLLL